MSTTPSPKTLRRLSAAEGYLELGMPEHALEELQSVENAGPFEASRLFLTGRALQAQNRFTEAIELLQQAAQQFPLPFSRKAWLCVSECYRDSGEPELAREAEVVAAAVGKVGHIAAAAVHKIQEVLGATGNGVHLTIAQPLGLKINFSR